MVIGPTVHFFCGKMAAGKSTFAKELARQHRAVLLVEDHFLEKLFPGEIKSIPDYVRCSSLVKEALFSHIVSLLSSGISVVLDFPGNTKNQRAWFLQIIEEARVAHELHYLDVSDEVCKAQLRIRSKDLPAGASFTTDAEFDAITRYFQPPSAEENFNVVVHMRHHLPNKPLHASA
jgi:predicted kinase